MPHHRRHPSEITPEYEDAGLFKTMPVQLTVELIPQMGLNDRKDLVVRGFVERHYEIEVLFAGRRTREAIPLKEYLEALLGNARKAAAARRQSVEIDMVRCPVRVEGSWRRRALRDQNDWETHSYQLLAARWSLLDKNGTPVPFGTPPVVLPRAQAGKNAPPTERSRPSPQK